VSCFVPFFILSKKMRRCYYNAAPTCVHAEKMGQCSGAEARGMCVLRRVSAMCLPLPFSSPINSHLSPRFRYNL
jgi:hypothetical protein